VDSKPAARPRRGLLRRAAGPLVAILVGLLLVELSLQGLALLTGPDARVGGPLGGEGGPVVLCLGDSHTYGWNVRPEDAWPARLQGYLAQHDPQARVVNLGLPGKHSGHLLAELDGYLTDYRPDLVVVLVGANNAWSRKAARGGQQALDSLRLVRLLRIAWQRLTTSDAASPDERTARDASAVRIRGTADVPSDVQVREHIDIEGGEAIIRSVDREGREVEFLIGGGQIAEGEDDVLHTWLLADLGEMAQKVRQSGGRLLVLTYADDTGGVLPRVNEGLRSAARTLDLPLVDQGQDFAPFVEEFGRERLLFPDAHPRRDGYEILAAQLHDRLVELSWWAGPALGDPAAGLRERPAAEANLALVPGERAFEVTFEPGVEFTVLLARAREPGFRLGGIEMPLARDALLQEAFNWPALGGRFGPTGRERVAFPPELEQALEAGPVWALLVVRSPDWDIYALGEPLAVEPAGEPLRPQ
jgi:lysophospholipase L1-like esterase